MTSETPKVDECFTKSDGKVFLDGRFFSCFCNVFSKQFTTRICDFELLLLAFQKLQGEGPKSQILVVKNVEFNVFWAPPKTPGRGPKQAPRAKPQPRRPHAWLAPGPKHPQADPKVAQKLPKTKFQNTHFVKNL